ncbi:MAG: hypothetical protein KF850_19965 [Labilithrix sp.]|nr:hypothetical protein [Labilithrix sp.]MBX3214321.1 hypothetical protein [Labilithrix sp.]
MITPEIDRMMRELTGEASLRPRRSKLVPESARKFMSSPSTRVQDGSRVVVGLKGGGRVEGTLARRLGRGVVIENEEGADVVVLDSAGCATRVLQTD